MSITIQLTSNSLKMIRKINERLVSFNIEMTEVTGGTFWKAYAPDQIAGTEKFHSMTVNDLKDITVTAELMEYYSPVGLYDQRLCSLANVLGTGWIWVSGFWATKYTMILTGQWAVGFRRVTKVY